MKVGGFVGTFCAITYSGRTMYITRNDADFSVVEQLGDASVRLVTFPVIGAFLACAWPLLAPGYFVCRIADIVYETKKKEKESGEEME